MIVSAAAVPAALAQSGTSVLVFTKTAADRHASVEAGVEAVEEIGETNSFSVSVTDDASAFTTTALEDYDAVVFLNTSGDVLDASQQAAFAEYVEGGGGFVGVHGAATTETDWEWFGELLGARAAGEEAVAEAQVLVLDPAHPSTSELPKRYVRTDGWYNFNPNPRGAVHVMATLDEKSYDEGMMGHDHPVVWAHEVGDGRAWYTALGHTEEIYEDAAFREHLLGGIEWAAGRADGEAAATVAGSFEKIVLDEETTYPMGLDITADGRVFYIERDGAVKVWHPETGSTTMAAFIPVTSKIEDGLLGIALHPEFQDNGWIYLYYSPISEDPNRLSRFTVRDNKIDMDSEQVMLEVKVQREECCHSGGELVFTENGLLYLSTGDNTAGTYPRTDERPGREYWDAQRSSGNTNDLRGKILRIRPEDDGGYSIPEGNLFEDDDPRTRPEIYAMGFRNPWRISVDPKAGWVYYGDVGQGNEYVEGSAPQGVEEFGQIREPGNMGMPYFVGDNQPYRLKNFETGEWLEWPNAEAPINDSPNNTGLRELPPAEEAWIEYHYGPSEEFPEMGVGSMSAAAGPVYYYDEATVGEHGLPAYYDGSVFLYEWARNWIQEVKLDENGDILDIVPFAPGLDFIRPIDLELGPDGRLYVLEWGTAFWGQNRDAQLVRLDYYGNEEDRPAITRAEKNDAEAAIEWPVEGGFFDFNEPIPYRVRAEGTSSREVTLQPYLGHDTHTHPLLEHRGAEGTFNIVPDSSHKPYIVAHFAEVEAAVDGGEPGPRVRLFPKQMEAENFTDASETEVIVTANRQRPWFAETAVIYLNMQPGGYAIYEPVNLVNIDTLQFQVAVDRPGTIEVRADAPDGELLGKTNIDPVPGAAEEEEEDDVQWTNVQVPVSDPGGMHALYVVFQSANDDNILHLNAIEFKGEGVMVEPDVKLSSRR